RRPHPARQPDRHPPVRSRRRRRLAAARLLRRRRRPGRRVHRHQRNRSELHPWRAVPRHAPRALHPARHRTCIAAVSARPLAGAYLAAAVSRRQRLDDYGRRGTADVADSAGGAATRPASAAARIVAIAASHSSPVRFGNTSRTVTLPSRGAVNDNCPLRSTSGTGSPSTSALHDGWKLVRTITGSPATTPSSRTTAPNGVSSSSAPEPVTVATERTSAFSIR